MALDNKISNIIGTRIPTWLYKQLDARSKLNAQDNRDNNNLLYLANKTAWVRVVSSINLVNQNDVAHFNRLTNGAISKPDDLAKQFALFGGTSKYINTNSYQIRSGLGLGGAYGTLGEDEIKKYGYRPMPGITSVNIETQGRLGSVRAATINFRCWDKDQLDIIDALYFKLGFTMFIEWGQTYFYKAEDPTKLLSTDLYSIDPFQDNLSKEQIAIQISKNVRDTEGNYDAMLGIVTNFNFSLNQEGGFDCSLRLMALGVLGDSIKINNQGVLPDILKEEIKLLTNTLIEIGNRSLFAQPGAEPELKTIQQVLQEASTNKVIKGTVLKIYPSSPEKIITTTTTIQEDGRSRIKQNIKQVFTGEFTKPDTIVRYENSGDRYIYITRIGQVVKYDQDKQYNGFVDINQLDLIRSNLTNAKNEKIGNFLSNIVLTNTNKNIYGSNYALGPRIFRFNYKSQNRQADGKVGEISKYIQFEFSDVNFAVKEGTNLVSDIILPAIREALNGELKVSIYDFNGQPRIDFKGTYKVKGWKAVKSEASESEVQAVLVGSQEADSLVVSSLANKEEVTKEGTFKISSDDTSIIKDVLVDGPNNLVERAEYLKSLNSQNVEDTTKKEEQSNEKEALYTQLEQALKTQSSLELALRTIQVHALTKAINNADKDLEIGRVVYTLDLTDLKDTTGGKPFLNQIFSNGIFSEFINELINKNADNTKANNELKYAAFALNYNSNKLSKFDRLKIQSLYGFATNLMAGKSPINSFSANKFETILTAYVVPYQINQEIYEGVNVTHPVYIPLSLLLMLLNHNCTIYDSKSNEDKQTPLVYVDFSTEHNFCLSNTKQLSTNPWVTLIPFEGGFEDYKTIFDPNVLNGNFIRPTEGSTEKIPLFNPEKQDLLSPQIPPFKFDGTDNNIYRGKPMNILLNIDYLVQLVRTYSLNDGTNSIYLKTFLEQVISDLNKYLGNVNVFRLAYSDEGNTFHIVDDQVVPPRSGKQFNENFEERMLTPDNVSTLPVFGKYSIAKNLEIRTDVSSKLSNMLAISANADTANKATLSTNGDNFGFINSSYVDRYVTNRKEIDTGSKANYDMIINSSAQFNKTVYDFYSTINPSEASVGHATNYFIERMSKIKNNEYPTRAAAMIPVSVNFTTDGISGMTMGQAFTIPDELLPYTYNTRVVQDQEGLNKDHINKVGFVVVGLNQTLENNQWNTNVRANMIFLKYTTDFSGSVVKLQKRDEAFGIDLANATSTVLGRASLGNLNINQNWEQIAFDFIAKTESFISKPKNDEGTLRAGYGTDKIVLSDGQIRSVGLDTVFSQEDAKRTLVYQIKTTFAPRVVNQIGQDNWNKLNDRQKAALVSFAYNAGSLTSDVVKAIKSNTGATSVANAIAKGPITGKVSGFLSSLVERRKLESTLYLS